MKKFDNVIIGFGKAGKTLAGALAGAGQTVALIERDPLRYGGTCINVACIPTKSLENSARLSAAMGGDFAAKAERYRAAIEEKDRLTAMLRGKNYDKVVSAGAVVLTGAAAFVDAHTVRVSYADGGSEEVYGEKIFINTGSAAFVPPIAGLRESRFAATSETLMARKELPRRLAIIGGGYIGMEFASLYAALGSRVTVLEAADRILANLDREFGQNLKMILKKQGVEIHTGAALTAITAGDDGGLTCHYTEKEQPQTSSGAAVLVAVGRRPATDDLFASGCAPAMERGRILVGAGGETSVPGMWALGDVTNGVQLAHAASAAAVNIVAAMLGRPLPLDTAAIPACVYTSPEIASVGLTADEAAARGIPAFCRRYVMGANGKTVLTRQERSFLKLVCAPGSGRVLGCQMMCARATDMIGEAAVAVANGLTAAQLARAVRPHPTYEEALGELARECAAAAD